MNGCYNYFSADTLGRLPNAGDLAASGVRQADNSNENPSEQANNTSGASGQVAGDTDLTKGTLAPTQPMICMGPGLPPLHKKMVEKIGANEYIDFTELPPAKGKGRSLTQPAEGQIILLQAADLVQSRKTIADYATWSQCYALYVAALAAQQPGRLADLMGYQSLIARASKKYKWPAWVIYDQNFRQEAAGNPDQPWAKAEPSLYTQCFTGQELNSENWCSRCQGLDHSSMDCPYQARNPKRPWNMGNGGRASNPCGGGARKEPCKKFNKYNGDCRFGPDCNFDHVCSNCGGHHPISSCKAKAGNGSSQRD